MLVPYISTTSEVHHHSLNALMRIFVQQNSGRIIQHDFAWKLCRMLSVICRAGRTWFLILYKTEKPNTSHVSHPCSASEMANGHEAQDEKVAENRKRHVHKHRFAVSRLISV